MNTFHLPSTFDSTRLALTDAPSNEHVRPAETGAGEPGPFAFSVASLNRERRRVLIVGSGGRAESALARLKRRRDVEVIGFVDSNPDIQCAEIRDSMLCSLRELDQVLMRTVVDQVLITLPIKSCYDKIEDVIASCEAAGVESQFLADLFSPSLAIPRYESTLFPVIAMPVVASGFPLVLKRLVDIVGAVLGLVLLAPLLLVVALAVKLTSPGPVFFIQVRCGYRKRLFRMLKFRTMVVGAEGMIKDLEDLNEAEHPIFKIRNDPRFTPIGRFLRMSSIDELPQLCNVLLGQMSLVGPRPMSMRDVACFTHPSHMRRFSVRPGLTGLWQVTARGSLRFTDWMLLDLRYIDNWSFWLDLRILWRTIGVVLTGKGAL